MEVTIKEIFDEPDGTSYVSYEDEINAIQKNIISLEDFKARNVKKRKTYIGPIRKKTNTIISAQKGVGKTMLGITLAVSMTHENCHIGQWKTENTGLVLLVDGEMAEEDLHERLRGLTEGRKQVERLDILSADLMIRENFPAPNLTNDKWKNAILEYVKKNSYDIVIFDNISTLAPGLDENRKDRWDPLNEFFLKMRWAGITTIAVFHMGKNITRGIRGHSAVQDSVDHVIELTTGPGHIPGKAAKFKVKFDKYRGLSGDLTKPFVMEYKISSDGSIQWTTDNSKSINLLKKDMAIICAANSKTDTEMDAHGICRREYANGEIRKAISEGILDANRKFTEKGLKLYGDYDFADIWKVDF